MLDDFFTRAVIGGIGVALLAGPLGCFIVWRRLAYFGDTLSHSALLGVAIALLLELNITFTVFIISVGVAMLLLLLQRQLVVQYQLQVILKFTHLQAMETLLFLLLVIQQVQIKFRI